MYYLHLWDAKLACNGLDGSLSKVEIPLDLAESFFDLASGDFPILSSLCLDDYDLFSDEQLEFLIDELARFIDLVKLGEGGLERVRVMLGIISEAHSRQKGVLFDPFRKN
jgi:hypothetical protein